MKKIIVVFFVAVCLFAKDKVQKSEFRTAEIAIDGNATEWTGGMAYLEKEKIAYSIQNDSSFLYLCIKPDKFFMRSAMMSGFIVWFDSTGKNKKTLGIRFPIGIQNRERDYMPDFAQGNSKPTDFKIRNARMLSQLDIIGPEKDDFNRLPSQNNYGIKAYIKMDSTDTIYELKIPLHKNLKIPYAVGSNPGAIISLGFETPELKQPKMQLGLGEHDGFGGGPGGAGGEISGIGGGPEGMGGRGGMKDGMGRPGGQPEGMEGVKMQQTDPIMVWLKAELAVPMEKILF
jgi:hypothetical protein